MGLYFGQSADEFTIRILAVVVMNVCNRFSVCSCKGAVKDLFRVSLGLGCLN